MDDSNKTLIAVIGATGHQGGSVAHTLRTRGEFRVRALTRDPEKFRGVADEVVKADLQRPETLKAAFEGAHGVFLVTNFWQEGTDELGQATTAVNAAKDAGVQHMIWSTLPDVEVISGGKFHVPHFTGKARADRVVATAGFANHTFVVPPFYYQNLVGAVAPQRQADGSLGWVLPLDPDATCIHMGDISEIGNIVAGAFAHPDRAGHGEYLPLVGDFMSFRAIVETLNKQGHQLTFNQVPRDAFAGLFPGASELAEMFGYFENHTYLGSPSDERIALANKIAGQLPTTFATWALHNFPVLDEAIQIGEN